MAPLGENARGAAWMTLAMAGFVTNDTFMKSVAGEVPLFQAILVRGIIATALIAALAWHRGALARAPRGRDRRMMGFRIIGEIGSTTFFLAALFHMPLANATAIIQATPLTVTLAAAWFLGDAVGWRRYSAIAIGLVGVLLIVRPGGEGFNVYTVAALAAVVFMAMRDVSTRGMSAAVPSLQITVVSSLAITVFAGAITVFDDWEPMRWQSVARLTCAALLLLTGYYAGIVAMRVGEIGFVAPFRYSNMLWALALGFAVFGEVPGWLTITGVAIVMATGGYALHRERVVARRARSRSILPVAPERPPADP